MYFLLSSLLNPIALWGSDKKVDQIDLSQLIGLYWKSSSVVSTKVYLSLLLYEFCIHPFTACGVITSSINELNLHLTYPNLLKQPRRYSSLWNNNLTVWPPWWIPKTHLYINTLIIQSWWFFNEIGSYILSQVCPRSDTEVGQVGLSLLWILQNGISFSSLAVPTSRADLEVQLVQLNHCDGVYSNYWNTLLRNLKISPYINFYV